MAWGGNPMSARWNKLYKSTPAELALESAVAAIGVPYRSQFPGFLYGFRFFPDFYLPTLGLVIEVDDRSHNTASKALADAERTEELEDRGWQVVRCTNAEALGNPHGTVRRLLGEAGIHDEDIELAKRKSLADSLPVPKKAAKKESREAKSLARQKRRSINKRN